MQGCRAILTKGMSNTELTHEISPEYKLAVPIGGKIHILLIERNKWARKCALALGWPVGPDKTEAGNAYRLVDIVLPEIGEPVTLSSFRFSIIEFRKI